MHFGQFLIQEGAITPHQILDALDEQRRSMPFLGRLAVEHEVMTVEAVLEVLDALKHGGANGTHFGDVAVALGFVDEATRTRLLELQRNSFPPLGEVLVRQGALDAREMAQMLKEFIQSARIGRGAASSGH
ncbi:MAG: hypothetical protein HZA53_15765 [Planctomycetes bacterium]|nr:hypothetical protein [Planctomycetota bacterium]